jgi:predicted transcriptional regulator
MTQAAQTSPREIARALADGPLTPLELADFVKVSLDRVRLMLGSMEGRGLVCRVGGKYELTSRGAVARVDRP